MRWGSISSSLTCRHLSNELGFSSRASFFSVNISLLFYLLAIFVMGWLSDHVGRKRMLVAASVGFVLFSVPLFMVMGLSLIHI